MSALTAAANAPGYPATHGTRALRQAAAGWLARRHGVTVRPGRGTAGDRHQGVHRRRCPALLGCGPGDVVVYPELAYPTYDIGARLAGRRAVAADGLTSLGPEPVRLVWVNSPSNPTGRVLPRRAPGQDGQLGPGTRARYSRPTSATSAWAGTPSRYRCCTPTCAAARRGRSRRALTVQAVEHGRLPGRVRHRRPGPRRRAAGDPQARRDDHARPGPGGDGGRAGRRRARRTSSAPGTRRAGRGCRPRSRRRAGQISHSEAGLYLWASRPGQDCWGSVELLARPGILVAPGEFYGPAGHQHIRIALTATDERIDTAVRRLAELS